MTNDYSTLAVCTTHIDLVGVYGGRLHRCACEPGDEDWREREWDGYDVAALIEMCCICVRDVVASGTRWSWRACETCRRVNNEIATALIGTYHPGNQVIPLGRHSLMNGIVCGPGELGSDAESREFAEALDEFVRVSGRIIDWRSEEGRSLIEGTGLKDRDLVLLDDWLDANPRSLGASVDALCRFVGADDLPELSECDDLRRARIAHLERSPS